MDQYFNGLSGFTTEFSMEPLRKNIIKGNRFVAQDIGQEIDRRSFHFKIGEMKTIDFDLVEFFDWDIIGQWCTDHTSLGSIETGAGQRYPFFEWFRKSRQIKWISTGEVRPFWQEPVV